MSQIAGTAAEQVGQGGPPLPGWLFRYLINPVMKLILRSPWHDPVSRHVILVTFQGRESGKQYTIPVGYLRHGDALEILTESAWEKNVRGGAPVRVLLQGQLLDGQAEVLADPNRVGEALARAVELRGLRFLERRFGLAAEEVEALSSAELAERTGQVVVRIALDEGSADAGGD